MNDARIYYSDPTKSVVSNGRRETNNLQVFYNFSNHTGDLVSNLSGSDYNADLQIGPDGSTQWLPGQGLEILGKSILYNKEVGRCLMKSFKVTEEISVENWIKPSQINQVSPSNILGIAEDSAHRIFLQRHCPKRTFMTTEFVYPQAVLTILEIRKYQLNQKSELQNFNMCFIHEAPRGLRIFI